MRKYENTVIRLLSRGAHGWAVEVIIDVVENLRRQETKLPAVPPIMTLSHKDGRQRQCMLSPEPPPGMSKGKLSPTEAMHTCTHTHTRRLQNGKKHTHTHTLAKKQCLATEL